MSGPYQGPPQGGHQPGGYPQGGGYGGYQPPLPPPRGLASRGWFWLSLAAVVVVAASVTVGIVLTSGGGGGQQAARGDGSPTGVSTPAVSSSSPSGFGTSADGSSSASGSAAALGTPITGKGTSSGEMLSITALGVDQSATPTDDYDKPPAGSHFAAVHWDLKNTGVTKYEDAVDNCAEVYDTQGTKYGITIVQGISSGPTIDSVAMAPGTSRSGWSVFAIPDGHTIARVSYTMDSGLAGGGSWNVG